MALARPSSTYCQKSAKLSILDNYTEPRQIIAKSVNFDTFLKVLQKCAHTPITPLLGYFKITFFNPFLKVLQIPLPGQEFPSFCVSKYAPKCQNAQNPNPLVAKCRF